ncbi:MAG: hypothetical protein L6R28_14475 [Planctomycetes bacterium]|nr:hypothetical protein [Planctomycetota bacterium]
MDFWTAAVIIVTVAIFGDYLTKRAKYRSAQAKQGDTSAAEIAELRKACEALDRRCAKLDEQVRTVHDLLADEQRTLDRKLNAILPDADAVSASKTIGPERESQRA